MLREPTARFLSRFFKYEFDPDAGVHSSGTAGKYRSEGLDRYISSRNASAMWEVAAIERFRAAVLAGDWALAASLIAVTLCVLSFFL